MSNRKIIVPKQTAHTVCLLFCTILIASALAPLHAAKPSSRQSANIDLIRLLEENLISHTAKVISTQHMSHPTPSVAASSKSINSKGKTTQPQRQVTVYSAPQATIAQPTVAAPTAGENVWQAARRLHLALPLPKARIVVLKSQRRLELRNGPTLVKAFRVALGANPVGPKSSRGDSRTPEGDFFICTRNATTSAFHIFLGLSYPALPDAERGVSQKAISWREFQLIRQRLASRSAPLWETRLGGWVGIHGGNGSSFSVQRAKERGTEDWTAGCLALTDREIEELYAATQLGTPVSIRP